LLKRGAPKPDRRPRLQRRYLSHFAPGDRLVDWMRTFPEQHNQTTNTNNKPPIMKNNNRSKISRAALVGLMVLGFAAASIQNAAAATLTAFVVDQQCQGGDFVNVTLSATVEPSTTRVRYTWDLNGDGIFDTPLSRDPMITTSYPDEVNVTATVKAVKGERFLTDSVSFSTLRCEG
jgi:hypothetical protein